VYGGNGDLSVVCQQQNVDEVLISSSIMPQQRLQEIVSFCRAQDIAVKRMRLTIEDLTEK
nr:hypothetical protein [Acidobacteriota bacterium]